MCEVALEQYPRQPAQVAERLESGEGEVVCGL